MPQHLTAACAAAMIVICAGNALAQPSGAGAALELRALSTRPETVSGGDVLDAVKPAIAGDPRGS